MDFYVARQPIFDRERRVFGYEMLFRSSERNQFDGHNASAAGSSVILHSLFSTIRAEDMLDGKRGFYNFDRELLLEETALLLPKDRVVIEILESVKPDRDIVIACGVLRDRGYSLALDDFVYSPDYEPLLDLADIVKIDVLATPLEEQQRLLNRLRPRGIRLLAEKIETPEGFEQAKSLGYTLYQGYFFARPSVLRGKDIPGLRPNYLRLLREINRPELNLEALEGLMRHDVALTYRLLRYLSSPLFGFQKRVDSVLQALVLLGEAKLRKWFALAALSGLATDDKPRELVASALLRAFFCEAVAEGSGLLELAKGGSDFSLTGLFSRLEAFLDCPLPEAIADLALPVDVAAALTGAKGTPDDLGTVLKLVCAYEAGEWESVMALSPTLPGGGHKLAPMYVKSLQNCREVFRVA